MSRHKDSGERWASFTIVTLTVAVAVVLLAVPAVLVWDVVTEDRGPVTWPEAVRSSVVAVVLGAVAIAWLRWRNRG